MSSLGCIEARAGATEDAVDRRPAVTGGGSIPAPGPPPPSAIPREVSRCDLPQLPRPGRVRTSRRLVYATEEGQRLELDLARPVVAGPHPVVVLLHGGGWRRGRREHMTAAMHTLAGLGYAAASVDYRLAAAPRNAFPSAVADARCAVRWLRAHAADLDLDPSRIAAIGFSAGGHLSAMLATASDVQGLDARCPLTDTSPAVQAAVSFFAPFDLRPGQEVGPGTERVIANFLGARATADPARAALASPIVHVDRADPPMLLVHGARDATVYVDQSRRMHAALESASVPATLVVIPRGVHGFALFPPRAHHEPATCTTLEFLRATIGVPTDP